MKSKKRILDCYEINDNSFGDFSKLLSESFKNKKGLDRLLGLFL
ncbi:hypothetical protein [Clostridium guangxiense]|nr:hypothetical protein [Clostridium guangxiense]